VAIWASALSIVGFAGWNPRLVELITAAVTIGRWALLDREPLERWNVTLLGDRRTRCFPFFAQGAAQAIEDGAVLALCLAADPADPAAALGRYERLRRPWTARLQRVSHGRSHINRLPDGAEQRAATWRTRRRTRSRRTAGSTSTTPRPPSRRPSTCGEAGQWRSAAPVRC
jgi:2-polyprenyl-6-methoxyphenol hydroxylase-like FAD-dependent oxidoreductase